MNPEKNEMYTYISVIRYYLVRNTGCEVVTFPV